jgi:hypothetical protein
MGGGQILKHYVDDISESDHFMEFMYVVDNESALTVYNKLLTKAVDAIGYSLQLNNKNEQKSIDIRIHEPEIDGDFMYLRVSINYENNE